MQYLSIQQAILEQIESGQLEARQKLPSERKLAELFDTTRVTLREALALLEANGRLYREDRRGWFIAPLPIIYDPSLLIGFVERAQQQQRVASHQLLTAQSTLATKEASRLMTLPPFSDLITITRIRQLEHRPVCHVTSMIVPRFAPNLLDCDFAPSVSGALRESFGVSISKIQYKISVTSLIGDVAAALNATDGAIAIKIMRHMYDQQHNLIGCSIEYWRHDAINIQTEVVS
ncbi:GntR family transcriptional regulator [Vibrio sp. qd031]|uniref:UTRA domain-containing protein n=1 Tax=Vibrio sp. qd031 TaxID=1603038 RepID=UPI000A11F728|nr:UTRA domain-containing protein [Vibrio sp. qd031]ORT48593.1 GntR family transcriptional regulator [Vibrio sp. qd031]